MIEAKQPVLGATPVRRMQLNLPADEMPELPLLRRPFPVVLWRARWRIAGLVLVSLLIAQLYLDRVVTPLYRATAVVMLEPANPGLADLQGARASLTGDTAELNTEMEVLRSRGLLAQVVGALSLKNDPEFNRALAPSGRLREIAEMQPWFAVPPRPDLTQAQQLDRTISALRSQIRVRIVPMSHVFEVTAISESPDKAALIANTLTATYIENQLRTKLEATETASGWLSARVAELAREAEAAQAAVVAFAAGNDLVSPEAVLALEAELADLQGRRIDAERRADAAGAVLRDLQAGATAGSDRSGAQALDDARWTAERIAQEAASLAQEEVALAARLERQNADLIVLAQLEQEAEAARLLHESFLNRYKATQAVRGLPQADSRLLSQAAQPVSPATPQAMLVLGMAGIAGFVLAAGLALLAEIRRRGIRDAGDLERDFGYPVLGQVPRLRNRRQVVPFLIDQPRSAFAEAFRHLRTSLTTGATRPPRIVGITSAVPDEGRTTTALALARTLAASGQRVLLIEADIRHPVLRDRLDVPPTRLGLAALLEGRARLDEVRYLAGDLGADVILGELGEANPADLFASPQFADLLQDLRARYDAILIDTPPILSAPDARIVAQLADSVLMVVSWDRTDRQDVAEAVRLVHRSGRPLGGFVLNRLPKSAIRRPRRHRMHEQSRIGAPAVG